MTTSSNVYGKLGSSDAANKIPVSSWPTTVWVYNYSPATFNAQHKNKLRKWCLDQKLYPYAGGERGNVDQFVMLPGDAPKSQFIDPKMCVDWEVVRKIMLQPRVKINGVTRIPGSYDIYTEDGFKHGVPGNDIRQECPLFYFRGNHRQASRSYTCIKSSYPKFTIVCLSENRVAKFQRILPAAKVAQEGVECAFKKWLTGLTDDQRLALHMEDTYIRNNFAGLNPEKILKDKDLREAARVAKIDPSKLKEQRNAFRYLVNITEATKPLAWKNPLAKYPLFNTNTLRANPDHVYAYINAGIPA